MQPAAMLPPDTVQVVGDGEKRPLGFVIDTDVSPELNPDPDTVTTCPVWPVLGESDIIGAPVTVKVAYALPPPPLSVYVTR